MAIKKNFVAFFMIRPIKFFYRTGILHNACQNGYSMQKNVKILKIVLTGGRKG